ncbi:MAG: PorT family protein [Prevotellaceae bacterium]|jgi:opacity protein-like surface antigen|nr:PorT family protein [Prevotellaceae bacterium]
MKKCLLIVCGLAFTLGLNAQLRFGAKVGGTMSSMFLKEGNVTIDAAKARLGFLLGGMMEYSFTESFALQPELLYVLNGAKFKALEGTLESTTSLHNIQLPVNLKYKMGVEGLKFYVTAGPSLSFIAGAKQKSNNISVDLFEGDEGLKRIDFGLGVGLGVEISKIAIGLNYNYGLSNIAKGSNSTTRTGTFALSVGYFF